MFDILDDPFACLATTRTVLVELRYALYLVRADVRKTFPPFAFAARLDVDSRSALLRSLDDLCLERIRQATRYAVDDHGGTGCRFTDYEADRYVVWTGLDDAKLPLSTLSDAEVAAQLEMMERRGFLDRIRVHMAIEVGGGGVESGACGEEDDSEAASVGSPGSIESLETVRTVGTIE